MKLIERIISGMLLVVATHAGVESSTGQGFVFSNAGADGSPVAPIHGPDQDNPYLQKWGNPTNASPPGTQIYFGPGLSGSNYSVEAWYSLSPVPDVFQLVPG